MTVLGVRAAVDLVTPTGVDAKKIFEFSILRSRKTAQQIVQEAATALGAANQAIIEQYGDLLVITEDMFGITRQGETTRTMTPEGAEFSQPDPVRSDVIGHMLPLKWYEDALGWTERYLRKASESKLRADVQLITERWLNRFDFNFITRVLTDTENLIGTTGYDVGWAIGTGDNVNYIPPQYRGYIFDSTHTHYVYKDDTSLGWNDLFDAMVEQLVHHGFVGRKIALVPDADVAEIQAATGFIKIAPENIVYPGGNTSSPISVIRGQMWSGVPGQLMGYYESPRGLVELYTHARVPTNYAWMTQPFGNNNAGNGVAVRVDEGEAFGMRPEIEIVNSIIPRLKQVNFASEFGIGVNDRLNGQAGYLNAGAASYVNPTIS
jgi:hypothetical protein